MAASGTRLEARILVRAALLLWLGSALSSVWHVLAQQAPDSPLHFGILAGPIGQLRDHTFALGAGLFMAALVWPALFPRGRGRPTMALLLAGSVLSALSLLYAASQGMFGVQIFDPRPDARTLVHARAAGHGLLSLGLLSLCARAFAWRADHT